MFQRFFTFLLLHLCFGAGCRSQPAYDSSFHYYYYDQKLSQFLLLPDQKDEVVWLGDSITDIAEWGELFPGLICLNRGISSDNTFGVLHRLSEITKRRPKIIFILIGINDIARNFPVRITVANYTTIIQRIKSESPGTKVVVQSIMPTNNNFPDFPGYQNKDHKIWQLNAALKALAGKENVEFLDLTTPFMNAERKLDERYTNDGVHLTGEGYQLWKKIIIDAKLI